MKKSRIFIFITVLLLFVGLACDATGSDPVENNNSPDIDLPGADSTEAAPNLSFTITNNSSRTVCSLFVAPQDASEWGEERLGTEVLDTGESIGIDIVDGEYTIRANDCDGDLLAEYSDIEVDGATSFSLEDKTVSHTLTADGDAGTLTVINNSSQEVCYVYISSTDATSWGDDWLDETTTLDDGDSETIVVGAGVWDLQAADCDGDALAEQYNVDLSLTGQTWTLD